MDTNAVHPDHTLKFYRLVRQLEIIWKVLSLFKKTTKCQPVQQLQDVRILVKINVAGHCE